MARSHLKLGAVMCGLAMAQAAVADQVQVQDLGTLGNTGRTTLVMLSGGLTFGDGSTDKMVWAGSRSLLVDGALVHAYAAELTGTHGSGSFEQRSAGESLGQSKAAALNSLFAGHDAGEFTNREQAAAFQAMIWEIVYDFDGTAQSLDLAGGSVRVGMIKPTLFDSMKASAMRGGAPGSLDVVGSHEFNDSLRVVPLPSAAALAGLGLAGLATTRRRSR